MHTHTHNEFTLDTKNK